MTERVQRLVDFFKKNKHFIPGCGIFNCRGTFRDSMHTIYDEPADGVIVDMCYDYDYIEIIGLTDEEFQEAGKAIHEMYVSPWEECREEEQEYSEVTKNYTVSVREDDGHVVDIATFSSYEEAKRCVKCVESDFGIRNLYIVNYPIYDKFDMLDVDQFTAIKSRIDSIDQ